MKKTIEQILIDEGKKIGLTLDEKARMKNFVFSHVEAHPLKEAVVSSWVGSRYFLTHRVAISFATVFFFMIGGVGTAAELSLPGNFLYVIKKNIHEPLSVVLSLTDESKARNHAFLAERRLLELEKLVLEGEVKEEIIIDLNKGFKKHADSVHEYVEKMESVGDIEIATDVGTSFESTLDAHVQVLEKVGESSSFEDGSFNDVKEAVALEADKAEKNNTEAIDKIVLKNEADSETKVETEAKLDDAKEKIVDLKVYVEDAVLGGENKFKEESEKIKDAEVLVEESEAKLDIGELKEAFVLKNSAVKTLEEASVLIKVQNELEIDLDDKVVETVVSTTTPILPIDIPPTIPTSTPTSTLEIK